MGYFDGFADIYIKTDVRDRALFFPWAPFGKGYVVPDREALRDLRHELVRQSFIIGLIIVIAIIGFHPLAGLAVYAISCVFYGLWVRDETRYWRIADEKMSLRELLENSMRSFHPIVPLVPFLIWMAVIGLNLNLIVNNNPAADPGSTAFAALIAALFGYLLHVSIRVRKK
jgi:hypothetical protein